MSRQTRRFIVAYAFALFGVACVLGRGAASGQTTAPTAAVLEAVIAAAVGPTPRAEIETWRVVFASGTGSLVERRRGDDRIDIEERAGIETQTGSLAGRFWQRNANGLTSVGRATPSPTTAAEREVVARSVGRAPRPIDGWEERRTYGNGNVETDEVARESGLVVRHVEQRLGGATVSTTYDDFRRVGAYTRAYHEHETNGAPQNDEDRVLVSDDVDAHITDADLAIAPTLRYPFTLPAGKTVARVPARFRDGTVYVRMTIGDHDYDFELDTGSGGIFIDGAVAAQLGLPVQYVSSMDVDRRFTSNVVLLPAATIGDVRASQLIVRTIPTMLPNGDITPVGLIGYEFFASLDVRLDFDARTVDALDPAVVAPDGRSVLDADLFEGVPVVAASIDDVQGSDFIFDTGSVGSGILFDRFVARHRPALRAVANSRHDMGGVGLAPYPVEKVVADRFVLAGKHFDATTFDRALRPGTLNMTGFDGLIGQDVISRFIVTTDYPHGRLILEPRVGG